MTRAVSYFKKQIATNMLNRETDLNLDNTSVLNDNDVNKIFGWAMFKTRKKYDKLCLEGYDELYNYDVCQIMEDMSIEVRELKDNQWYKNIYYPKHEELQNQGKLTLIHSNFCRLFSKIL